MPIDSQLAEALKQRFPLLAEDAEAHRAEHAAEVQLPFLQVRRPDCTFVPIALGTSRYEILEALGHAIADTLQALGEPVLLIASSDMNHYENDAVTRQKDSQGDRTHPGDGCAWIVRCGDERKHQHVRIRPDGGDAYCGQATGSDCGSELVKYATSGDVSGDRERVVGYAGVIVR